MIEEGDRGPGNAEVAEAVAYTRTLTCSTVRGELISSPRRIMDLCVSTSESWKASKPRRSLAIFSTNNKGGHTFYSCMDPHHSWEIHILQLSEEIPGTPTRHVTKPQHKTHSPLLNSLWHTQSCKLTYPVWGKGSTHYGPLTQVSLSADNRKRKALRKAQHQQNIY